jgi:hypothetical protein
MIDMYEDSDILFEDDLLSLYNSIFKLPEKGEESELTKTDDDYKNLYLINISNSNEIKISDKPIQLNKKRNRFQTDKPEVKTDKPEVKTHTKYDKDNICKKLKRMVKDDLLDFINSKIKFDMKLSTILKEEKKYEYLLDINTSELIKPSIEDNKRLQKKKLKDIFEVEISGKCRKYDKNHNKNLIQKIYEIEEGKEIKAMLEINFLDCWRYYRKDENYLNNKKYACLKGLELKFDNLRERLIEEGEDEEYIDMLFDFIYKYDKIFDLKKQRVKGKSKFKLKNNNLNY